MKIQICSDLHLEFEENRDWLRKNPLVPKGDILIIAGDTYHLEKDYSQLEFINRVSDEFQSVYLIPGNHEYYGGFDISTAMEPTYIKIKHNVYMLNNQMLEWGGVQFMFSTMWSQIQRNELDIKRGMMDFHRIKYKGEKFTIGQFNEIHNAAFEFITKEIKTEGRKVVVTHHLPSYECNSPEFKGSILNEAFCVDKTNFILDHEIDCWIYGHSHRNLNDFMIGDTKMVTNQLGYVGWNEHRLFNSEKIIEII